MSTEQRSNFGSKLGVILASAGSAVGLGNIWRFPITTGNNGGAAFIIIYIGCVLLLGIPVMMSEFVIGRHSRSNTAGAYKKLAPGTQWKWLGRVGVFTGLLILSYYTVVAGWTLEYIVAALRNGLTGKTASQYVDYFNTFVADPWRPLFYFIIFMLITHYIIVKGVEKGIEKYSKIMMPALFIIVIVLAFCSMTLPNSMEGVKFLLKPDFSKITTSTFLDALGQAFYSLSLGMGCLCTYASYFKKDTNLTKTAFTVAGIDTLIAVLAGFIIFPAAFSVGINPDAGTSLVFITLPNVFQQAFHDLPFLGYIVAVMFYLLLALAALTSTISLHEVATAYLHEEFQFSRKNAARIVTAICIFLGAFCSLSFGLLNGYKLFGLTIFDLFDFVTAKLMMTIGGFFISVFVGWYLDKKLVRDELTNDGSLKIPIINAIIFILKYIAPLAIFFIFVNGLGFLDKLLK